MKKLLVGAKALVVRHWKLLVALAAGVAVLKECL